MCNTMRRYKSEEISKILRPSKGLGFLSLRVPPIHAESIVLIIPTRFYDRAWPSFLRTGPRIYTVYRHEGNFFIKYYGTYTIIYIWRAHTSARACIIFFYLFFFLFFFPIHEIVFNMATGVRRIELNRILHA